MLPDAVVSFFFTIFAYTLIIYIGTMDKEHDEQQMQLQLDLRPEVASGIYSNLVLISHSHSDFVLDFAAALPGLPKPEVEARVIMAPEHVKRLLAALQENVYKYEQEFGEIDLAGSHPRMISPFGKGTPDA